MDIKTIAARFKQANVPLDGSDTWTVQKATVIKHAALERLAAGCEIQFDAPQVLRAEERECVLVVTGRMGDKAEWSIGEACIGLNYRVSGNMAGYPYAMAEKRAKDRVIIKLVGLHGVYSSEEADDFKSAPKDDARPAPATRVTSGQQQEAPVDAPTEGQVKIASVMRDAIRMAETKADLDDWLNDNRAELDKLPEALRGEVRDVYASTIRKLRQPQQEAAE